MVPAKVRGSGVMATMPEAPRAAIPADGVAGEPPEVVTPPEIVADEPPQRQRRRARRSPSAPGPDKPPVKARVRRGKTAHAQQVTQLHAMVGATLTLVPQPVVRAAGAGLVQASAPAGPYWDRVAAEYPQVYDLLDRLTRATLIGEGLQLYAPVLLGVLTAIRSGGEDAPPDPLAAMMAMMMADQAGPSTPETP